MPAPQRSRGNERAHSEDAQLVSDIDYSARCEKGYEPPDRPRRPRGRRTLGETAEHGDAEHGGRPERGRRRTNHGYVDTGGHERTKKSSTTGHASHLEQKLHCSRDDRHVKSRYRQHVDETRRGVPIAHLGGDLPLVCDEERAGQRGILSERFVDRPSSTRSNARQEISMRRELRVGERPLWRSHCGRDDRRPSEHEREACTVGPACCHSNRGTENRHGDRQPRDTAEPDQQSGSINEICRGDEGQARSTWDFATLRARGRACTIIQRAIESIRGAG
jgi:hypothetical protein